MNKIAGETEKTRTSMATSSLSLETAVRQVKDYTSLIRLLANDLLWEVDPALDQEEMTFEWTAEDLNLSQDAANRLNGGLIRQLRFTGAQPPWGVFFVEFSEEKLYRTALRQILRGLVPKAQRDPSLKAWQRDQLLFICSTHDYRYFTFVHFSGERPDRAVLKNFGWEQGDTHIHTLCEFNLKRLAWPDPGTTTDAWLTEWASAFDVEVVTQNFFREYREVFESVESEVLNSVDQPELCRLYTQRLFNRLMFLYFIEKKGWLEFEGSQKYLRALFSKAESLGENFLQRRLHYLFFWGLSNVGESREAHTNEEIVELRGRVPYLNGGLFDIEDDLDERGRVIVSNAAFARILNLFERYNFTVVESTPLDVQVAVDPEMLGKVFEELVTGRHESGSYYTPRPVVSFMCRQALKQYLTPFEANPTVLEEFVEAGKATELKNPERVLDALRLVRICDPACGSGAYLLGMMQELLRLRAALFSSSQKDHRSVYGRKREIIENNLYGVDGDAFAVRIACLRLWLSLAIESDEPQPLPNLDFKIERGDSLAGPSPSPEEQLHLTRTQLVRRYQQAKSEFLTCENSSRKNKLRDEIDALRAEIALSMNHKPQRPSQQKIDAAKAEEKIIRQNLRNAETDKNHAKAAVLQKQLRAIRKTIAQWDQIKDERDPGFDWAVEFAEVFSPPSTEGPRWDGAFSFLNEVDLQPMFTEIDVSTDAAGFDIVLANPPYVRADAQFKHIEDPDARETSVANWKEYRAGLLSSGLYKTIYEKWDLYVPFLERAYHLLRGGGQMVFIVPDAYNKAKYAAKSHSFFLKNTRIRRIDFCSDIPLFKAGVFNTILHFEKGPPRPADCISRVRRIGSSPDDFELNAEVLPTGVQADYGNRAFQLEAADVPVDHLTSGFLPLTQICYISYGLRANADDRYWKGEFVTEDLVSDHKDKQHPRPFIEGKDIVRWWTKTTRYLEWGTARAPGKFARPTFPELHDAQEKLIALVVCSAGPPVVLDNNQRTTTHTACVFVPWWRLKGVRNKSIRKTALYSDEAVKSRGAQGPAREQLEHLSQRFQLKFLVAVMNSTFAGRWLDASRRSNIHVYPDDWKRLPIPRVSAAQQQPFIDLVDAILSEFEQHGYPLPEQSARHVAALEQNIDALVETLYQSPPEATDQDSSEQIGGVDSGPFE